MDNKEKTFITWIVILAIGIVISIAALIIKDQENSKYKAIVDMSCKYAVSQSQCKAGMKLLMNMSPDEIRDYGSFNK